PPRGEPGEGGGQGGQSERDASENEDFAMDTRPTSCGHMATRGGHRRDRGTERTGHYSGQPGSGVQGGGQCEKPTLLNGSAANGHLGHTAAPRNGLPAGSPPAVRCRYSSTGRSCRGGMVRTLRG